MRWWTCTVFSMSSGWNSNLQTWTLNPWCLLRERLPVHHYCITAHLGYPAKWILPSNLWFQSDLLYLMAFYSAPSNCISFCGVDSRRFFWRIWPVAALVAVSPSAPTKQDYWLFQELRCPRKSKVHCTELRILGKKLLIGSYLSISSAPIEHLQSICWAKCSANVQEF